MSSRDRGVLIAGNWKMNHGPEAARAFFAAVAEASSAKLSEATRSQLAAGRLRAAVFPTALALSPALEASAEIYEETKLPISVGAQNVHWEKSGAFTGEISGPMLKEAGSSWALVGHSERRQYFGETDETARKRTESLVDQGMTVILCVGETRAEREADQTERVLERQLSGALLGSAKGALDGRLIIAYEPVWAIGTGLTATPQQAQEAHAFIRRWLRDRVAPSAAERTQLLYGGSVTPENVAQLLACPDVDGALVGGASLKPDAFLTLVEAGGRAL